MWAAAAGAGSAGGGCSSWGGSGGGGEAGGWPLTPGLAETSEPRLATVVRSRQGTATVAAATTQNTDPTSCRLFSNEIGQVEERHQTKKLASRQMLHLVYPDAKECQCCMNQRIYEMNDDLVYIICVTIQVISHPYRLLTKPKLSHESEHVYSFGGTDQLHGLFWISGNQFAESTLYSGISKSCFQHLCNTAIEATFVKMSAYQCINTCSGQIWTHNMFTMEPHQRFFGHASCLHHTSIDGVGFKSLAPNVWKLFNLNLINSSDTKTLCCNSN